MLLPVLTALVLTPAQGSRIHPVQGPQQRTVLHEDFDEPGTTWAPTLFPDEQVAGAFLREPLTVAMGAPDTFPPLPINAGGDLEGRFGEDRFVSGLFTLAADSPQNNFENVAVRGVLAVGAPDPFGSQNVGFLLRASINPHPPFGSGLNAYTVILQASATSPTATVLLGRWRDGVVTVNDVFATATFPVDLDQENYLVDFRADGELLTVRLWRISAAGGGLVVAPIPVPNGGNGPANLLSARDGELHSGRVGVYAFARGANSVFLDDVEVGQPGDRVRHLVQPPGPPTPTRASQRHP